MQVSQIEALGLQPPAQMRKQMKLDTMEDLEKAARQQRKPVAAVHMEFEKNGTLGRIASHIQTDKTLNFLFENARKTA